jgi:hypothetical protein
MPVEDDAESAKNNQSAPDNERARTLMFDDDPSLNPQNWPQTRKVLILAIAFNLVANGTNGTSLASGGIAPTIKDFGLDDAYGWKVFPVSICLVGYFIGNTILVPLSENYGRRPVNLVTSFCFAI